MEDLLTITEVARRLRVDHMSVSCTCTGKQCSRCEHLQCVGSFHRFARSKDGYRAECKQCRKAERETDAFKAKRRAHYKERADHINELKRVAYQANPQKARDRSKAYRERNRDVVRKSLRIYNRSERGKERTRIWGQRNPEKRRTLARNYRNHNPKRTTEIRQIGHANYKARRVGSEGILTIAEWREIKAKYDYACVRCGRKEPDIVLTIDHIQPFYLRGLNHRENIQPLCSQCNSSKGVKRDDYRQTNPEKQSA